MRPRFLALIPLAGKSVNADLCRRLRDRLPRERSSGSALLFHDAHTPYLDLPLSNGWIVGRLFSRANQACITSLTSAEERAVESTGGDFLLQRFWGSYAALWQDGARDYQLFRDPSATLPVFHAIVDDMAIATSDLATLVGTGLIRAEPDWEMVRHGLLYPQLPTARTHLKRIHELLPGMRVDPTKREADSKLLWQPWAFANTRAHDQSLKGAADLIADAVDTCVMAYAGTVENAHLELSGGLDSSIIAASLARAGKPFSSVTIASPASDGDERDYARLVANHVGASLVAVVTDRSHANPCDDLARWTPRPRGMRILARLDRLLDKSAQDIAADAIFSGTGGDNVFFHTGSTAPVIDACTYLGIRAARQTVFDVAQVTGTTAGQVCWHALKRRLGGDRSRRWVADRSFLARDVDCPASIHPWMRGPIGTPAGTRAHIGAIVRIHDVLDAHRRTADRTMIFPLLAQPVMEACLSIPSWQWVAGGRNRAVARHAFADRLPAAIIARSTKGVLNSLIVPALEQARMQMRELLCEGLLSRAGLLDRRWIASELAQPLTNRPTIYPRILELVDAELWLRSVVSFGKPVALGS